MELDNYDEKVEENEDNGADERGGVGMRGGGESAAEGVGRGEGDGEEKRQ